jgi:hypothetical protein
MVIVIFRGIDRGESVAIGAPLSNRSESEKIIATLSNRDKKSQQLLAFFM